MNIFRKYTKKSLASNRSRTLVTIIGIILSMALLTAVIEGAYSGEQFMVRNEEINSGKWHAYFSEMDDEKLARLSSDPAVRDIVSWKTVGAAYTGKTDELSLYLIIDSIPEDFLDLVSVNLASGRMPLNDSEIIVPHNMSHYIQGKEFHRGDIIELSVGDRISASGEKLYTSPFMEGETLENTSEKSYTVVGIYNRLDSAVVPYSTPGYIALTAGDEGAVTGSFVTLKDPSKAYDFQRSRGIDTDSAEYISSCSLHVDLLNYSGTVRNSRIQSVIYGFAAILVVMVAFGSISLIYNSFSISLSERTKQFGILRSVGATKKQLRSSVLYEALYLSAIGIPAGLIIGCAGIGITLYALRDAFSSFTSGSGAEMKLVLNPAALVISAVLCLILVLVSAWIPAARAVRIDPVQAIRQNADTKIKARSVRTSRLTQKIFGFEGTMAAKNFKRNAKRYRTTVVSLFMSVVLFISASSFCSFLTGSVEGIASDGTDTDIVCTIYGEDRLAPEEFAQIAGSISGIDKMSWLSSVSGGFVLDTDDISDKYWSIRSEVYEAEPAANGEEEVYYDLVFVNDDEFRSLIKQSGLSEDAFFDSSSPKAVMYNHTVKQVFDGISDKYISYSPIKRSAFPLDAKFKFIYVDEKNNDKAYFADVNVAAEVSAMPMMMSKNAACVMYPFSMIDSVFADPEVKKLAVNSISYGIKSRDHAAVRKALEEELESRSSAGFYMNDLAESRNSVRMIVMVVNVFAYGFIILISLIALANVFNTVSTSILLRRREFAMLRSIGLSQKGFSKMMNYECVIYGARSLLFGLPVAILMTVIIWKITAEAFATGFYLPMKGIVIAVASVFIVVFATMLYATRRIRRDNPIDALRNENL